MEEILEYTSLLELASASSGHKLITLSQQMALLHDRGARKLMEIDPSLTFSDARRLFSIRLRSSRYFSLILPGKFNYTFQNDCIFIYIYGDGDSVDCDSPEPVKEASPEEIKFQIQKYQSELQKIKNFLQQENLHGTFAVQQTGSFHENFVLLGYVLNLDSTEKVLQKYSQRKED